MRTIYIAGRVTGAEPEQIRQKFIDAETMLHNKGYDTVNPIRLFANPQDVSPAVMEIRLRSLRNCDGIYMLPCAVECPEAQKELDLAIQLNLDLYCDKVEQI